MPKCNQDEFFMEPKKVEQGIALEKVSITAKIFEEVDKSQEECKGVGINKFESITIHEW